MIEEQSEIINKCDPAEVGIGDTGAVPVMIIGNNNVFEVGGVETYINLPSQYFLQGGLCEPQSQDWRQQHSGGQELRGAEYERVQRLHSGCRVQVEQRRHISSSDAAYYG